MTVISVFIINYNGAYFIKNCLDSVLSSQCSVEFEIIVVDNSSTDDSLSILSLYENQIKIVKNNHNSGFSKGNNIAAMYAKGDCYFLLNNDTILNADTIEQLYQYMKRYSDIGALVPKLLNKDGTIQCPGSIFGRWRFHTSKATDVPFVAGAALLMTKKIYHDIGGLDENLFFYNDDVDLCKVLIKKQLRLVYYPLAELIHIGGLSTKFRKIGSLIEGYRGGFYVCHKHYNIFVYQLYRFFVMFDIIPRMIIHLLKSLFRSSHLDYVRLYIEVIKINLTNSIFVTHPKLDVDLL